LGVNASEALGEDNGTIVIATDALYLDKATCAVFSGDPEIPEGPYVRLEVADTGCGMAPQTLQNIFDPFFTTKFTGRGLGLAAVHGIVRGHRGAIQVTSEPGTGTTFQVFFPASGPSVSVADDETPTISWRGDGTVLIVDDEEIVRDIARRIAEQAGFSVLVAGDGEEAIRLYRQHQNRITCVLLDLTMPKMDGVATLRELRRIHPEVHVILSSGYGEEGATKGCSELGLAGFIQKPYELDTMTH
jgi:two-component system, cell cycle sensor histidine kinase and response regulator CckA